MLGISAYYHDSAAALIVDGQILAAAQEERFSRKKHDSSFPHHAVRYVLQEAGLALGDVHTIAFYDKPFIKFERLLETYYSFAPQGLISFCSAIPAWIKEKLFMKKLLREELAALGASTAHLVFPEHHLSHAGSAFFPSPFSEAAILTVDGVGEWATTTIGHGKENSISLCRELHFPHSIGLLYSAFTYYCGFKVNSGEYKLMGLAPYGSNRSPGVQAIKRRIYEELVDVRTDGSLLLNMKYFAFATGLRMVHEKRWQTLFGFPRRKPEGSLTQEYIDMAAAIQEVTEEIVLRLAHTAKCLTGSNYLVMAGGVALNCVANGKLVREKVFNDVWIQPAAGAAGGALGAALCALHIGKNAPRHKTSKCDLMHGAYLGPEFLSKDIIKSARRMNAKYHVYSSEEELVQRAAELLAGGNVVGWFQGKMEFGPRALGNRSILGDPRNPAMQKKMNVKIKYRESFRPFAPSVLEEDIAEYFNLDRPSPYMLLVAPLNENHRATLPENYYELDYMQRLYVVRSDVPAITHVDFSARVQSVNKSTNQLYWKLISEFKKITGIGLLVNTSFNVRGEPI
ncbi:MAG: hypothetical protein GF350_16725, partial [Chitinivibrionales bacterium]|nr:hypothetical protein [Chitinivibrionales bacterium]